MESSTIIGTKKRDDNLDLRRKIEQAIRNSLDPLSAQRALESLCPLFEDLSGSDRKQRPRRKSTSRGNNQRQSVNLTNGKKTNSCKTSDQRILLPSIQSILNDYRNVTSPAMTSEAVQRQSISEPIPIINMFPLQQRYPNEMEPVDRQKEQRIVDARDSELNHKYHKDESYNAEAALSLLRLERISRRPDFSNFWDWKAHNIKPDPVEDRKAASKDQLEKEINLFMGNVHGGAYKKVEKESKVERVKRMQMAYRSNVLNDSSESSTAVNSARVSVPPQALGPHRDNSSSYEPNSIRTDQIEEQYVRHKGNDVTDSDLVAISKYFSTRDDATASSSATSLGNGARSTGSSVSEHVESSAIEALSNKDRRNILQPRSHESETVDSRGSRLSPLKSSVGFSDSNSSYSPYHQNEYSENEQNPHYRYNSSLPSSKSPSPTTVLNRIISPKSSSFRKYGSSELLRNLSSPNKNPLSSSSSKDGFGNLNGRNIETPHSNDFSLGGIDGLLDWTRNLDLDIV